MPIKKLRFSFDLPIGDILALIATRNEALQIDVVTDNREPKKLPKAHSEIAGLIEGPQRKSRAGQAAGNRGADEHGAITGYMAIAILLMKTPEAGFRPTDVRPALEAVGLNPNSASPQLSVMKKAGHIKPINDHGEYRVTPNGARHFTKIIREREEALSTSKGK